MRPTITTLRARLLLVYLGLIVIGYGGLTLLAGRQIAQYAYDDFANTLQLNAFVLASNVVELAEEGDCAGIEQWIQRNAGSIQASITILDLEGRCLVSNLAVPPTPNSFVDVPEVLGATNEQIIYDVRLKIEHLL